MNAPPKLALLLLLRPSQLADERSVQARSRDGCAAMLPATRADDGKARTGSSGVFGRLCG